MRGIQYRFSRLANDAEQRAEYLAIKELLPAVNEDIENWRSSFGPNRPAFPTSENIRELQRLLGLTGDDADGVFGPATARRLAFAATTPFDNYSGDPLPKLGIADLSSLNSHIRELAPNAYGYYVEKLADANKEAVIAAGEELDAATTRIENLTRRAFETCTGQELAIDKDAFLRKIVGALATEGSIDSAIETACGDILEGVSPELREELLTSLQTNLAGDISRVQSIVIRENELVQLRILAERYPGVALDSAIESITTQRMVP